MLANPSQVADSVCNGRCCVRDLLHGVRDLCIRKEAAVGQSGRRSAVKEERQDYPRRTSHSSVKQKGCEQRLLLCMNYE